MSRTVAVLVGVGLLVCSAIVQGVWTGRWATSEAMQTAAARLTQVPQNLGRWQGHDEQLDARQLTTSEAAGHVARRYVGARGNALNVLLLCGRPGPIAVHQPDVCYAGAGYILQGERDKWSITPAPGQPRCEFWTARFSKPGSEPAPLRVFWAWGTSGDWGAPDNPRLAFGRKPNTPLYKLYVVEHLSRLDEPMDKGSAGEFMQVLLPELRKCLAAEHETYPGHILALGTR